MLPIFTISNDSFYSIHTYKKSQEAVKKVPKKKKEMDLPDSFGNIAAVDYKNQKEVQLFGLSMEKAPKSKDFRA